VPAARRTDAELVGEERTMHWRAIGQPVEEIETPFLAVDLDKLERNIAKMRRIIIEEARIGWRPHTKAIKIPAIAHMLLAGGAHGVTCAKLSEAEVMAASGIRDILIANQVVTPHKIVALARLLDRTNVTVAVDCEEHLHLLEAGARTARKRMPVVIEVNMGINRAGVEPGEAVLRLARAVASRENLHLAGLMGWEGHTTAIPDRIRKRAAIEAAVKGLTDSAESCRAAGLSIDIVSCGGTGTYWITARLPGVTEVQAGGGIYSDVRYRDEFGVDHECALTVWTTVISRPTPTRIVCDAGWKGMARYPTLPQPLLPGRVASLTLSAEHATIEMADGTPSPRVGRRVEFIVGYSDSTVFLHDWLWGTRNGRVEVVWPNLGRGKIQ
jgi:D-serine deaminase-like pyridoxal phosphate-dependent protein